ncbi:hypothetical protein KEM55_002028, partial [Ascosphaera atra]
YEPAPALQVEAVLETQLAAEAVEVHASKSASEQPKKRCKTAKPELSNLIRTSRKRSETIRDARAGAAKIKADAQKEESHEAR